MSENVPIPSVVPMAVSAVDRLRTVYGAPGPYATLYLTETGVGPAATTDDVYWRELRSDLIDQGAEPPALDAIAARLRLPRSGEIAGICVIAAADGTTAVATAFDPPHHDLAVVDTLPYAGPMLEWDQRSVPHVVVTVDRLAHDTSAGDGRGALGGDVVAFGADRYTSLESLRGEADDLAQLVRDRVHAIDARLVVVDGEPSASQPLLDALATALPVGCRVVPVESADANELADQTVRLAADTAARATVERLRTHKFLQTHDGAVDGVADTVDALAGGTAEWILIHDDPGDQRRLWVGPEAADLSLQPTSGFEQARLVDAVIRSAVLQNVGVHIIPSTGNQGPDDDIAAILEISPEI